MSSKLTQSTLAVGIVVILITLAFATSLSTTGNAEDNYEERLDALETRVAVLEEEVGIGDGQASQSTSTNQQSNTTNSSQTVVSGSSSQNSQSYSGSFSSSGNNEFDVEIDSAGTYSLAITGGSAFTVELVGPDGKSVEDFSLVSDNATTLSATGELQPGLHTLRVDTDSMWTVTITSSGS